MEVRFSIRVVDEDGNPMSGVQVLVQEDVLLFEKHLPEMTGDDGWAHFSWKAVLEDWFYVTVWVDGTEMGRYTFYDGDRASVVYLG